MKKHLLSLLAIPLLAGGSALMGQPYNVSLPQQCNLSNPGTNEILSFPGNLGNASGPATLTITSIGDIGATSSNEYVEYFNENNVLIGASGASTGNCNSDVFVYMMPLADVLTFSADGLIQITVVPSSGVNTSQCSAIGTAAYCSQGTLSYPTISGGNNAGVSALVSPNNICAGTAPFTVAVQNDGGLTLNSFTVNGTIDNGTTVTPFGPVNVTSANLAPATNMNVNLGNYAFLNGSFYDITAWVSNPNGVLDSFPTNDTLVVNNLSTQLSGTYTVGSGGDFATMVDAVNTLSTYGVCGPTIFDVIGSAPTFSGALIINSFPGSSSTNTVVFKGHGATISATPNSSNYDVVQLNGADYVTLDSFNIVALDATYGWGVHLTNQADHNTIINCVIDVSAVTNTGTSNGCGIAATVGNSYTGYGDNANYTLIKNNHIKGGPTGNYIGINLTGTSTTVHCVGNQIIDNKIDDIYIYSIRSYYQEGATYSGNNISRPTKTNLTTFYGIYMYYNLNMTVTGNKIHHGFTAAPGTSGTTYCMYVGYDNSTSAAPTIISNNVISDNETNGTYYAFYHVGGASVYYYHNTISMDYANQSAGTNRGIYQTTACSDMKFKNNLISITNGGSGVKHGLYFNTNTTIVECNNNDIYMNSLGSGAQYTGRWNATDYPTLANWQTANSNAYDQNSVAADPVFLLPSQSLYAPSSPAVNNIGAPIAAVTTDINGAARSAFNPDPGAYEFTPANDDAGIIAINGVQQQCPGSVNVSVDMKNFGVASLFSCSVNWTVNGVPQTPVPFIGSLGTTNTTTINLGSITMSAGVPYNIVAWTTQPNGQSDGNTINDTSKVLGVETAMSGIYTISATGDFPDVATAATALADNGVCAPVVMNVAQATYSGQVVFNSIPGASATNTITFNGNNATISANPNTADRHVVRFNGADYVKLDSFNIIGTNVDYGYGIQFMNESNNNTISNCTIDLTAVTSTTAANAAAICFSASTTSPTSGGNNGNNNTIMNNHIMGGSTGLYYGITMYGLSPGTGVDGNQIIDNTMENLYYYYVYGVYATNNVIRGNDMSRATKVTVSTFVGVYLSTGSTGNLVENNRIHNTHDAASSQTGTVYAIYITGADAGTSNPNLVQNNQIYNINGTGTVYAFYNSSSDNAKYYYNTISLDHTAATAGTTRGFYQTTAASGIEIKNNIFSITRGGSGIKHGLYFNTNTSSIDCDNNIVYVNSAGSGTQYIGYWSGTSYSSMAAWRAGATQDASSDSLSPNFVSIAANDYTPNTFSGNNIGVPISGITTDILGAVRSSTTPDPGSIEFLPIPTNDSCHQAIPVIGGVTLGTTTGATTDNAPTCVVTNAANGVWYTYTASGDFVSFSLCGSSYDTRIRVFTGACNSLVCVDGNEDFCSTQSEVSGCTEDGETYFILVHGNGTANGEFVLTITETPVQQGAITASAPAFCPGDTVILSAASAAGYLWNDAGSSTTQDIEVTTAGSYYTVITDTNGCMDTSNVLNITEYTVVAPTISVLGDTSFCSGDSVILTSSIGTSYLWNDPNMSTTPSISVNTGGSYQVYTVDANGCGEFSDPVNIAELPLPVVDLGDDQQICDDGSITLDAGGGVSAYFWSTGDTTQTITFSGSVGTHTINVTVTDGNGCQGTDQIEVTVVDCTGIEENSDDAGITVYPNPGNGEFYITLRGFNGETATLRMTDYQGKMVHTSVLPNSDRPQRLDLAHLAEGIYLLTVSNGTQIRTMKLVVR